MNSRMLHFGKWSAGIAALGMGLAWAALTAPVAVAQYVPKANSAWAQGGDIDGSGSVNVVDALCLQIAFILNTFGGGPAPACLAGDPGWLDYDCDGDLDALDVQTALIKAIGVALGAGVDGTGTGVPDQCEEPDVTPPPPCPGNVAYISTPAHVVAYSGCTTLDDVYLHMPAGVGEVNLPLLETVTGFVYLHQNNGTTAVRMPSLTSIGRYLYFHQNQGLANVELGALQSVGEYVYFHQNLDLVSVDLHSLETVGEYVHVVGNTALTTLALDALQSTGGGVSISPPVP